MSVKHIAAGIAIAASAVFLGTSLAAMDNPGTASASIKDPGPGSSTPVSTIPGATAANASTTTASSGTG